MHDELFEAQIDAEFAKLGDITPLPEFSYPDPSRLPYKAFDLIHRFCGVDLQSEDTELGAKAAANEWFWRRADGQRVSFDDVYQRGSLAGVRPTRAATTPPTTNG